MISIAVELMPARKLSNSGRVILSTASENATQLKKSGLKLKFLKKIFSTITEFQCRSPFNWDKHRSLFVPVKIFIYQVLSNITDPKTYPVYMFEFRYETKFDNMV